MKFNDNIRYYPLWQKLKLLQWLDVITQENINHGFFIQQTCCLHILASTPHDSFHGEKQDVGNVAILG